MIAVQPANNFNSETQPVRCIHLKEQSAGGVHQAYQESDSRSNNLKQMDSRMLGIFEHIVKGGPLLLEPAERPLIQSSRHLGFGPESGRAAVQLLVRLCFRGVESVASSSTLRYLNRNCTE